MDVEGNEYYDQQWARLREKMNTRYHKEYQEYFVYALERWLINTYDYDDYAARAKVMQDFEEVKKEYEEYHQHGQD